MNSLLWNHKKSMQVREAILACCEGYIEADKDMQFGYVVPGHGK